MTGQLNRVDVTVLPLGWTTIDTGSFPSEVSGSWSPALSPDGRHAAYVSDRSGRPQVWVQPVGSDLKFLVDTGDAPVAEVQWSTGGGWLACLTAPGGAPRHEVWLVRPDGSELHQVAGFGSDTADNMRWLPGRSLLALTENLTTALTVDPVTGDRTVVASGELVSLLDVSSDGTQALLRFGPRGDRWVVLRDLSTGDDTFVTRGEQAVFAGDTICARSESDELPQLIRLVKGELELLAWSDRDEVETFAVTADGRTAAVLWNVHGGESRVDLIDLDAGTSQPLTPQPGRVISGLSWCFDGSTLAFTAEAPGQPHGVWVSSAEGVRPVSAFPAAPDAVVPTLETFTAHDGLTLTGWLFRPAGDGPHPVVLWFHGGPEAQERPGHGVLFQALVARGIAVFAPNVRGSSGFGRSFVNADNLALRYDAIEDVRSCVRFLQSSFDVTRVGIMGRSYGGYLTLAALTTFPDMFAVGIDVCGMSNFATFYEHTEPWIAAAAVSKYGDPLEDRELLADLSPITRIDRLRTPLMIVHGENDSNVPVIEAEQVVNALAARGVPHRYLLFPNEGHELLHRSSRADYLRETVDWLTTHLQPQTA
ncbi:S9 family peptidase [Actinoplanes bogorensis]|uniref:S9 family peptidase n=1 Tax=Paractinoplanes bogorensis TaxID=1610840 RepID=A0ABS5YHA1_9ACTN|nr:S9 family peptidase [Actinoplanes bogorensis]MBU2662737.1 S9 family peptidase [Actinoplanes bogorensis]